MMNPWIVTVRNALSFKGRGDVLPSADVERNRSYYTEHVGISALAVLRELLYYHGMFIHGSVHCNEGHKYVSSWD